MFKILTLTFVVVTIGFGIWFFLINKVAQVPSEPRACTMEAKMCPDGSAVGRTGPNCEFAACPAPVDQNLPGDIEDYIESKADLIKLTNPKPLDKVNSPLVIEGEARGYWFFEASFPVSLVNWDGLIIAQGIATAQGEWMTEEFVPFSATLNFATSSDPGRPDFMKKGAIILKKDNPSGLPENDDALEIPVVFE